MTDRKQQPFTTAAIMKKRQSLLQACAELSSKCGARILVMFFIRLLLLSNINPPFPTTQCIITMPDDTSSAHSHPSVECNALGLMLPITDGNTVVFDSVSPAHEVEARNNKKKDTGMQYHHRFNSDFTVRVLGNINTFLTADTAKDYRLPKSSSRTAAATTTPLCVPDAKENTTYSSAMMGGGVRRRYQCEEGANFFSVPPPPPSFVMGPLASLNYLAIAANLSSSCNNNHQQTTTIPFNSSAAVLGDDETVFKPRVISSDGIVMMQSPIGNKKSSSSSSSSSVVAATVSVSHIMNMNDLHSPNQSSSDLVLTNAATLTNAMEIDAIQALRQLTEPTAEDS